MMGTINCIYETPCGWCSKWDKECDRKISWQGNRAKCNPIDDTIGDSTKEHIQSKLANIACKSEDDHEWECCGVSTVGSTYRCKKCYAHKTVPYSSSTYSTISSK